MQTIIAIYLSGMIWTLIVVALFIPADQRTVGGDISIALLWPRFWFMFFYVQLWPPGRGR